MPGKRERCAVSAAERQRANHFLAHATGFLAAFLNYEETLAGVARLAVRSLADFCIIDIVDDGRLKRRQALHTKAEQTTLMIPLLRQAPQADGARLTARALQSRQALLFSDVTPDVLADLAQGEQDLQILQQLSPRSLIVVPLPERSMVEGALIFGCAHRRYDDNDRALIDQFVEFATVELANARSYREARDALDMRDRVMSVVAHDLRNPLNTIMMSADLLRELPLTETQRSEQLDVITRSAERMNRLVQDLLDVARLHTDQLVLDRAAFSASRLAAEAVHLSMARAAQKGIELRYQQPLDDAVVNVDVDRLLQVLTNLIDNAIKFTSEGGLVEVRLDVDEEESTFTVSDTGRGIPEQDIPNLFKPFWQGRRRSGDGVGLGLAIAAGIVAAHDGRIGVESEPGVGSRFHFAIPNARVVQGQASGVPRRARDAVPASTARA